MSSKREAHNNLASYSKQIKSNNHVFSSQFQQQSMKVVTSPTKAKKKDSTLKKSTVIVSGSSNGGSQITSSGYHRRSKTDGNVNQAFQPKPKQDNENMKLMRHQLEKFEMMQGPSVQSRQNNVNTNINSKNNKNSNQSAQSAKLKQLSQNHSKMFSNFTMEQAAKNLKLINNSNVVMQAPTRNTNLQSQPNKDKIVKQMCNINSNSTNHGKKFSEKKKGTNTVDVEMTSPEQEESIATPSGNVSIEQLKELMKNPQVAQFLKHQLELQQKTQQKIDFCKQSSRSHQISDGADQLPPRQSQRSNKVQQSQQFQICDITEGSNLNSDTSQEILKYQREWAMKFHEQVRDSNLEGMISKKSQPNAKDEKYYRPQEKVNSKPQEQKYLPVETNQGRESSSLVQLKNEESKEQISLLPESAFVNINAMSNLNNNTKNLQVNDPKINFYEAKRETENSTGNNTEVILKDGFQQMNKDAPPCFPVDQLEQLDDRSRNILNGGKQLSLMTENTDILDNSADLLFTRFEEDSKGSQKEEEDEYLTFQLCEGEEMNNEMANFIGIHMLNDGYIEGEEPSNKEEQEGGLTYQCPKTGSHFEFIDLIGRMRNLKQKRTVIDGYIKQEDERQIQLKEEKAFAQKEIAKQKQLQKQKKLKTQVQNILKSAQQDVEMENEDNLNDSMPHTGNIMTTDEDVLIMEEEDHLQTHHVTTNAKNQSKINNRQSIYDNNSAVTGPLQNQGKTTGKIYNTHDGRQKQAFEGQVDNQGNNQYANYDSYANPPNFINGRVTAGSSGHQNKQNAVAVHHQAGSLASNHASKISHFSKTNQPQNQTQTSLHDHQQMEYNYKYSQNTDGQQQPIQISNDKTYYKTNQGAHHQRGQSDDFQVNTINLMSNQNVQGNTVIHTNQLSSLADTGQNTHQFNTALGSQREDYIQQRSAIISQSKGSQYQNKLIKKVGGVKGTQLDQKQEMGQISSSHFKKNGTKSSLNRNDQNTNLKQTAQFGPQMNLIKSQLPHQQMVQNEMRMSQNKNMMGSTNQIQQQKIQSQFKNKNIEMMRQTHNNGITDPSKHQQYMTNGQSTQNTNQRQMMILQQNNAIQMLQQSTSNSQETAKQRSIIKKQTIGKSSDNKISTKNQGPKPQATSNIYQTQQQRKTKLINSGGNLIVGYDIGRGTSVGGMSNGSGPNIQGMQSSHYQTTGVPNPSSCGGGSIGRNEQQIQPTQPITVVTSIPSSVQSASKKYQTHMTNINNDHVSKGPLVNFNQGAPHQLQSYSFDYRQQHSYVGGNTQNTQPILSAATTQPTSAGTQKKMLNVNSGIVRHTKNMRSFDAQSSQPNGSLGNGGQVPTGMQQAKSYITSGHQTQGYSQKTQQTSFINSKHKSSSLNNPKETQNQNQGSQVQRQANPAQIVISKGIRLNDQAYKVHQLQTKTTADQPRDSFYKGMHKKVKSTTNQGFQHTENSLGRMNYNSASGTGTSKQQKNSQPKYQNGLDGASLQMQMVHNDQYNIGLNQNINAFEEQGYNKAQNSMNLAQMENDTTNISSQNPSSNKMYKSKRVTANTRGITSGTNARVNTFDNRGIQAAAQNQQRQSQVQQNSHKNDNRNQTMSGPHRGSTHQSNTQSHPTVTQFQSQQQQIIPTHQGRPTSSQGIGFKTQNLDKPRGSGVHPNLQHSQTKLVTQSQNQRNNCFQVQNFQNNKSAAAHNQGHLSGNGHQQVAQTHQQQSPKKNIYLLNYQGNVSII